MPVVLDIHFVLAYLVALCAIAFSWNALGRRVVSAVLGLQVLVGIALAATLGAHHEPLPNGAPLHIAVAIVALALYGAASRFGRRPEGTRTALGLSIAGLLCVAGALYLGFRMLLVGLP